MRNKVLKASLLSLLLVLVSGCDTTINSHGDHQATIDDLLVLDSSYGADMLRAGKEVDSFQYVNGSKIDDEEAFLISRYTINTAYSITAKNTTRASQAFETYDWINYYKSMTSPEVYEYTKTCHYYDDQSKTQVDEESSSSEFEAQLKYPYKYYEEALNLYSEVKKGVEEMSSPKSGYFYSFSYVYVSSAKDYYYCLDISNANTPTLQMTYYFQFGKYTKDGTQIDYLANISYKRTHTTSASNYSSYTSKYIFFTTAS